MHFGVKKIEKPTAPSRLHLKTIRIVWVFFCSSHPTKPCVGLDGSQEAAPAVLHVSSMLSCNNGSIVTTRALGVGYFFT